MKNAFDTVALITDESLSAMDYARQALKSAETAFRSLRESVNEHSDVFHMARMGELFCMDQGDGIDCLHEEYRGQLSELRFSTQCGKPNRLISSKEEVHS